MSPPLTGRTIALAEGRQLEELAQMLEKEGARTLRCPMIGIIDAPDEAAVVHWLCDLVAGHFDYVVLMTGEGVRRLIGFAERAGMRDAVVAALGRARSVVRGPKPVRALKEVGLAPSIIAAVPTTDGVIESLRAEPLAGMRVGVQLVAAPNPPLTEFLTGAGATALPVLPYVYAPAADADCVADLLGRLPRGEVDAVIFTSSPQVDRLFEVAAERQLAVELSRTCVAAVGPVVAESLHRHGAPVHVCPEQGFVMKNLVKLLRDALSGG
jgi:uroporphyrinogen-III synthase